MNGDYRGNRVSWLRLSQLAHYTPSSSDCQRGLKRLSQNPILTKQSLRPLGTEVSVFLARSHAPAWERIGIY